MKLAQIHLLVLIAAVVLLVGFAGSGVAWSQAPAQTPEDFKVEFGVASPFMQTAQRFPASTTRVLVTFFQRQIRPLTIPFVFERFALPTDADPCSALLEMFQGNIPEFGQSGIPSCRVRGSDGTIKVAHGVFLHPTVFVGSTGAASKGGFGAGKWNAQPAYQFAQRLTFEFFSGGNAPPTCIGQPVGASGGAYPRFDGPDNDFVRVFGPTPDTNRSVLVVEDVPSVTGLKVGDPFLGTPVVPQLDDAVASVSNLTTIFVLDCSDVGGPGQEFIMSVTWAANASLRVGHSVETDKETSSAGGVLSSEVRPQGVLNQIFTAVQNGPAVFPFVIIECP